jgi:hypothetical protein
MRGCYHDFFRAGRPQVVDGNQTPTTSAAAASLDDERREFGAKSISPEIVREERPAKPANLVK